MSTNTDRDRLREALEVGLEAAITIHADVCEKYCGTRTIEQRMRREALENVELIRLELAALTTAPAEALLTEIRKALNASGVWHLGMDTVDVIKSLIASRTEAQQAEQAPASAPLNLAVIREWPEGFEDRLQEVWLDVISFIPNIKLYDLQRVLAEFGFTMEIREAEQAPSTPAPDVDVPAMPEPGVHVTLPSGDQKRYYSLDQMRARDAQWAARLAEAKALADSEGSRAVQYLRRARKAEAELAAHAAPTEPSDGDVIHDLKQIALRCGANIAHVAMYGERISFAPDQLYEFAARTIEREAARLAAAAPTHVAWALKFPSDGGRLCLSTVFDTEEEAKEYASRCESAEVVPLAHVAPTEPSDAVRDVLAERRRQVEVEGWTPEHDDDHGDGAMAYAAAAYAVSSAGQKERSFFVTSLWAWTGWASSWFKPKSRRGDLVRSGALIIAEIERLDRAARKGDTP